MPTAKGVSSYLDAGGAGQPKRGGGGERPWAISEKESENPGDPLRSGLHRHVRGITPYCTNRES